MKVASVEAIVRALNEHGVRFLVVGGIAVNAHGYGRTTFDLDLVIQLSPENIRRAFAAFSILGYTPLVPLTADDFSEASNRARWKREKGMFVLQFHSDLHRQTRVDVFVEEPFDFDVEYTAAFQGEIAPELLVPHSSLGEPDSNERSNWSKQGYRRCATFVMEQGNAAR